MVPDLPLPDQHNSPLAFADDGKDRDTHLLNFIAAAGITMPVSAPRVMRKSARLTSSDIPNAEADCF
jgi:hypothetical protein